MGWAMIRIDGSIGEGGGQILRSALALSMALGRPFTISRIRANRPKPGLMRQHLTAVEAAAAISNATVTGASTGSCEFTFEPGEITAGTRTFSVGTAGSTTLVLQAVLPALLFADGPSEITIEGGTHARWAPPFEFMDRALVPLLNRLGSNVTLTLERHGFYPAGGGRLRAVIEPGAAPRSLDVDSRGELRTRRPRVLIARLAREIAERELVRVRERLGWEHDHTCIEMLVRTPSPGNILFLEVASEGITEVFSGIGEQGKPAEAVADEAIDEVVEYLSADAPVGRHLADQLMVPMAIAASRGAGRCGFRTLPLSRHATTNAEIINAFMPGAMRTEVDGSGTRWSIGI